MRTEVNTTRNYKEDVEGYYLAKAGINLAMAEIMKTARFNSIHETYGFIVGIPRQSSTDASAGKLPDFEYVERTDIPLGNGTVSYQITDENGKINLNKAPRDILIKALRASGVEIGEQRDIIADSILDWIDKDDDHLLNGAESDYYQGLSPPYNARNGFFNSVDELLKVRGMTEEILYGSQNRNANPDDKSTTQYLGIERFLTVQDIDFFNPNTADPLILPVFFADAQVEQILTARREKGFYNDSISTHFRIEATGKIDNSRARHTIVAIVQKFGGDRNATLLIRYWNDNVVEI
jgi:type II secretory pathway component PulK